MESALLSSIRADSGQTQNRLHELIIIHLDPPTIRRIESPKCFAHLFNHHAGTDETVECDAGVYAVGNRR